MYQTVVRFSSSGITTEIVKTSEVPAYKKLGYKHITDPKEKAVYIKSTSVYLNDNYVLFEDGSIYSYYSNKWLKIQKTIRGKGYYGYSLKEYLGERNLIRYIHRLLYYHFIWKSSGYIYDMPLISFKDDNPENFLIDNLVEITHTEKLLKINKAKPDRTSKIKDTKSNKFTVASLLKRNVPLYRIGKIFGCSDMSVHRFIKRNEKELLQFK